MQHVGVQSFLLGLLLILLPAVGWGAKREGFLVQGGGGRWWQWMESGPLSKSPEMLSQPPKEGVCNAARIVK